MKAADWLIKEGYPSTMAMTRDNLANIIDRYISTTPTSGGAERKTAEGEDGKCIECGAFTGHSALCSRIDLEEAKKQLKQYHELWLTRELWARKRGNMWRKDAERWKGKFFEVKHENNKLRKKNVAAHQFREQGEVRLSDEEIEAQNDLWDKAALELFLAHNPNSQPTTPIGERLIAGFKKDMKILSLFFTITKNK